MIICKSSTSISMVPQKVCFSLIMVLFHWDLHYCCHPISAVFWRCMENTCRAPWSVPVQVTKHRVYEQDIPPKYRWTVRTCNTPDLFVLDVMWHRSGSVCLDVINQTWSPMFGEFRNRFTNGVDKRGIWQIWSISLKSSYPNYCDIRIPMTLWMAKLLPSWCDIRKNTKSRWKVRSITVIGKKLRVNGSWQSTSRGSRQRKQ